MKRLNENFKTTDKIVLTNREIFVKQSLNFSWNSFIPFLISTYIIWA